MSTKNLARTVIEGGRRHYNRDDRRQSHADARAAERGYLARVVHDIDVADALALPVLRSVGRDFYDKLGPCDRWMRAQVGRPWRKVHAEIMARFDTRSLAGQHIVFDHLLPNHSEDDGSWRIRRTYFRVDAHGILRIAAAPVWRWAYKIEGSYVCPCELERALSWAAGRKVATHGTHYYWCEPTLHDVRREADQRYRQARALDQDEARYFEALTRECRERLAR